MKTRLDIALVERGLMQSRERAKAVIMSGIVYVNGEKVLKAGDKYKDGYQIEIRGSKLPFVSRGGLKLDKAVKCFTLDLNNKICMDIGASTGGFTDCMLQNGAIKVYAVDVGYGQLAWKLRNNEKVINMERTNIRYVEKSDIDDEIDFISIDVAFISLKLVLPVAYSLLKNNSKLVALVKPQFEAGKDEVGKKGVVKDIKIHKKVICDVIDSSYNIGFNIERLDFSPIKGPEGNIEFLLLLSKAENRFNNVSDSDIDTVVNSAHEMDV